MSGSLSLGLFAQGEPFVDEDQEYTTADQVAQTATNGICIFVEWATALPKKEFVKIYAKLTQVRKDPIIFKHTTHEAFTLRLAIQLVTPSSAWFQATQVENETHRETHKRSVFADTTEKINTVRIMLTQREIALDEAFHHIADIIRNIRTGNTGI